MLHMQSGLAESAIQVSGYQAYVCAIGGDTETISDRKERTMAKAMDMWTRANRFIRDLSAAMAGNAPRLADTLRNGAR